MHGVTKREESPSRAVLDIDEDPSVDLFVLDTHLK